MKSEIKKILSTCPKNQRKKYLSTAMIDWLNTTYPNVDFSYQCHIVISGIEPVLCPVCGNIPARGKDTCSRACREQHKKDQGIDPFSKMKDTLMKQYGVDNPAKLSTTQRKRLKTMNEKYGGNVSDKARQAIIARTDDLNRKGRDTLKEKYGVNNPGQLKDHHEKCVKTMKDNYGVTHYTQTPEWRSLQSKNEILKYEDMANISVFDVSDPSPDVIESYNNPNRRITFKCNECNTEETLPSETFKFRVRTFATPCGKCSDVTTTGSAAESEIADFIERNYIGSVLRNDRTIIAPFELDIVIPDKKIAIEYCGLYWHNEERVGKRYHYDKMVRCIKAGYHLITIFEDEWIHKPNVVKNRLLYKLGIITNSVYARKTTVHEIKSNVARDFINKYHIQGYVNASIRYGLYLDSELVAVMTFSKSNASKGSSEGYELSRFCTVDNTIVVGGASKLFKHFITLESPEVVFTYSDLRWNTGAVYSSIGFTFDSFTGINYWYVDGNHRKHRYGFKKQPFEDRMLTERELRKAQGLHRIYDCGNHKFIWKK